MFGYIRPNMGELDEEGRKCFRSVYCGLCRAVRSKAGPTAAVTLSYDLTFLALLLSSLYSDEDEMLPARCPIPPFTKRGYRHGDAFEYAASIDLLLFYYKCDDDWNDDKNPLGLTQMQLLRRTIGEISTDHPQESATVADWISSTRSHENAKNRYRWIAY